jgi:hypothetical protein
MTASQTYETNETEKLLKKVTKVLSEELGEQTGELFYTSYQNKSAPEIIKDARELLSELVGPVMALKKISEAKDEK